MKTAIKFLALGAFFVLTGFTSKVENKTNDWKDFYIFVYCHDKKDYNKVYVSEMIHYTYDSCGQSYDWRPKVEKSFKSYLTAEYDNVTPDYIYLIGSTTGSYVLSSNQAREKLNEFISEHKEKGHTVTKTNFNYSCD